MRAIMAMVIKGLQNVVELCIVDYHYTDQGSTYHDMRFNRKRAQIFYG